MTLTEAVSLPVLDEAACEDWVLAVLLQQAHWCRRHAHVPFFTLGLAAYLDAVGSIGGPYGRHAPYHQPALRARSNALLTAHFGPLLRRTAEALQHWLGAPTRLADDDAALPGFHIYLPHPALGERVASVHRDLQYRAAFGDTAPAAGDCFSFTLPLATPPGTGLAIWPDCRSTAAALAADAQPPQFHPYQPGQLMVHDGLQLHQAVLCCTGDEPRITLQGHGLRQGHRFLLYW